MSANTTVRDVLLYDPLSRPIPNDGVAEVSQEETLTYELESFVCEGQYAQGLERILNSYLGHQGGGDQPAAWVSGFYGSGKSHLVKVLRYLWTDDQLPSGATARGLAHLPDEVKMPLKELSTAGKRAGGLHAAAGKLQQAIPLRRGLLAILFASAGLPQEYPLAHFCMWLRDCGQLNAVRQAVAAAGRDWDRELRNLYVSPFLSQALVDVIPGWAHDQAQAKALLKEQFPKVEGDISDEQMAADISDLLAVDGKLPCTLLVLDELQQYIAGSVERATDVQYVAESCSKGFDGRLLLVATGQSALSAEPNLSKIQDRFTVSVHLSDADVETVIRKLVLAKLPERGPEIASMLTTCSGEIDRHLRGTRIAPRQEDRDMLAADYPVLPVRWRFWEAVLRGVDKPGTAAQLRTQLRIVHEAVSTIASRQLGTVVPADFIYNQLSTPMLQSGVLLRDLHETIEKQRTATPDGDLRARVCALAFLMGQLPTDAGSDLGVRATAEMLADLLVEDLRAGSAELRSSLPAVLDSLVEAGALMKIGEEYRMQTREGSAWEAEFRTQFARIRNDLGLIAEKRTHLLQARVGEQIKRVKIIHGRCKEARAMELYFSQEQPVTTGTAIPVWVRDGWEDSEKNMRDAAHQAGTTSPVIFVFLPRRASDELRDAIAGYEAATITIDLKGLPTTPEGIEARNAMQTRADHHKVEVETFVGEILREGRVYQGGGNQVIGDDLGAAVDEAAEKSLARLFPSFDMADDSNWGRVIQRVRTGDGGALAALGYQGEVQDHPVCKVVLDAVGAGHKGGELQQSFRSSPYGWPQDAVDGALLCLVSAGLVTAQQNGQALDLRALDQTKIKVATFNSVSVQFTAVQRIAVRKLLQEVGINCKSNEEIGALPGFVQTMVDLAKAAGGEPPLPAAPSTLHLQELATKSGNEQGVAVYEGRERLTAEAKAWKQQAQVARQRLPRWEALERLLGQAEGLPVHATVKPQAEAIRANRSLLDEPDAVTPLAAQVTEALRDALRQAHADYTAAWEQERQALEATDGWQQLTEVQREQVQIGCGLGRAAAPSLSTESEVLASLSRTSLPQWKDLTDALPQRFGRAREMVAKLLQPATVAVHLRPATLTSEPEVDAYLTDVRTEIMQHVSAGHPVQI